MEKRDEFTDNHAMAMLAEKINIPEGNCRQVLRALNRNGFVVNEIVADDDGGTTYPYGTIESLNHKFDRTRTLEFERQGLINEIKQEWNIILQKYKPLISALTSAMEATHGTPDTFPGDDAGSPSGTDELSEVRSDV